MRKILTLFFCVLFVSNICAQEDKGYKIGWYGAYNQHPIIKNVHTEKDSTVVVVGSGFIFTVKNSSLKQSGDTFVNMGLCCFLISNTPQYVLKLEISSKKRLYAWKDSPLLLKLADNQILEFKSISDSKDNYGRYVSAYFGVKEYEVNNLYEVSREDINKMAKGITKIRFKINSELFDIECYKYKNDEVGDFIFKELQLIDNTLPKYQHMDVYEGF